MVQKKDESFYPNFRETTAVHALGFMFPCSTIPNLTMQGQMKVSG